MTTIHLLALSSQIDGFVIVSNHSNEVLNMCTTTGCLQGIRALRLSYKRLTASSYNL